MIFRATRNLGHLIEEVLVLSKVEQGQMKFAPSPLDLATLCRQLADEVLSATNRSCPIELRTEPSLELAQGDAGLLRHILTNLLSNAVKYSAPGTPVTLEVARAGNSARFTVGDRGIGIHAADQRNLFKAFARGGNVDQRPGTGLGLVIVKRCVDLHGGKLELHSAIGTGTTVTPPACAPANTSAISTETGGMLLLEAPASGTAFVPEHSRLPHPRNRKSAAYTKHSGSSEWKLRHHTRPKVIWAGLGGQGCDVWTQFECYPMRWRHLA